MQSRTMTGWGLAGLLTLALPAAAQTSYFGAAEARAWAVWSQADPYDHAEHRPAPVTAMELGSSPVSGVAGNQGASPASEGNSRASYELRPGGMHIVATASALGVGSGVSSASASAESFVSAIYSDRFVLSVGSAAPGTVFSVRAIVFVSGLLHSEGQANDPGLTGSAGYNSLSTWSAEAAVYNNTTVGGFAAVGANGFCRVEYGVDRVCGGSGFGNYSLDFKAAVGQLNQIYFSGDVRATADGSFGGIFGQAGALAAADLGHTIAWGGIQSVQDGLGNSVDQFSALSATSGFDYRQPYVSAVPEPAAWLSLTLGLLLLVGRKALPRG